MKALIVGIATVAVAGGVAFVVSAASNGNETEPASRHSLQRLIVQEDPDSLANASLVVYSSYGAQMSEYNVTLKSESGDSLAYHVDDALGGYPLSDLGVEDGTYDVIVTDRQSGDSATIDDVIVNAEAKGITTYEVGSESKERSKESWSYMETATNKLEAANLFWEQCQELESEYGSPSTFTDAEFNFIYPTGLFFVDLVDVNEDGEDEMVVCYVDQSILEENIANRSPYKSTVTVKDPGSLQVFQYNRQYHDLDDRLWTSLRFRVGKGAIAFANDVPIGVSLVNCDLNANCYWRYDFSGDHPEGKVFGDFGGYQRNGERVGPTEAEQGIHDLLSNCTLYNFCGEIDPNIPAEVLPYSEAERVTGETLDYLSHADEVLFQNSNLSS